MQTGNFAQQVQHSQKARRFDIVLQKIGVAMLIGCVLCLLVGSLIREQPIIAHPTDDYASGAKTTAGLNFDDWPKDRKPEVVFVLSGQMMGYLQPCGCSRPQLGGLERRANLIAMLKEKGWEVIPIDVGGVPYKRGLHKQALMKYGVAMKAMKIMGYEGVGLGREEYSMPLMDVLSEYTLNHGNEPRVLNATLARRKVDWPDGKGDSMIGDWKVVKRGNISVGIVGLTGPTLVADAKKIDPSLNFEQNNQRLLQSARVALTASRTDLNVLLYDGTIQEAQIAVQREYFPEYRIVLALSEDDIPPAFPKIVGNDGLPERYVISIGHKGRYVGLVGVFRNGEGLELKYKLAPIGEEFETPAEKAPTHDLCKLMEQYALEVKNQKLLAEYPKIAHPTQVSFAEQNPVYVGSDKCMACHMKEYEIWKNSKHAHAYDALAKIATKPSNRQYDGECIVCHTVGFSYRSGYVNEERTPHLKHVGCENCHGPGSLHIASPLEKKFFAALSPWKLKPDDRVPAMAKLNQLADAYAAGQSAPPDLLTPEEQRILNRVDAVCQKCHDADNDPHFRFESKKYWPNIIHSGFRPKIGN